MPFKKVDEAGKVYSVRITPTDREYITAKYNSLGQAMKILAKGGKHEQAVDRVLELEDKLKEISNNGKNS